MGDLGIWWLASVAEKDGERGGRFPTVRHEYFLGLIGRPQSPAQAQTKEREERRRLDLDRGNTIFTSSEKGKQNHRERWADLLYIIENEAGQCSNGLMAVTSGKLLHTTEK